MGNLFKCGGGGGPNSPPPTKPPTGLRVFNLPNRTSEWFSSNNIDDFLSASKIIVLKRLTFILKKTFYIKTIIHWLTD